MLGQFMVAIKKRKGEKDEQAEMRGVVPVYVSHRQAGAAGAKLNVVIPTNGSINGRVQSSIVRP